MGNIYDLHDAAFKRTNAYVVLKDGKVVAKAETGYRRTVGQSIARSGLWRRAGGIGPAMPPCPYMTALRHWLARGLTYTQAREMARKGE